MNFPSEPQTYLKAGKTFFFRLTFDDIWKRNSTSPARRTSMARQHLSSREPFCRSPRAVGWPFLREISEEAPLREVRVLEKSGRIQIHESDLTTKKTR